MANIVHEFTTAKTGLLRRFKCPDDYFVKPLLGLNWEIAEEDGIFFLNYWKDESTKTSAVVVKKDEQPLTYKTGDYTMVIAIDCIKIAFIFNNVLRRA